MGTVRMSDLLEQARAFDPSKAEPRTTSWAPLEEGFASDAQRRAAFASGYKEKGKKKDKKEDVDLDEKFSPKEIKMAIGVASDPRYKRGNYTGAVNAIEKIKKGLSQHPQVAAVLKRQNEEVELDEMKSKNYALAIK